MKITRRNLSLIFLPVVMALGFAGCATYDNTQQKDSAIVRGTEHFFGGNSKDGALIWKIDGVWCGFWRGANSAEFVPPGKHEIIINTEYDDGSETLADYNTKFETEFVANHRYRFSSADSLYIILWDETDGAEKQVTAWNISYQNIDAAPIAEVEFTGAELASPPLYRDYSGMDNKREPTVHSGGSNGTDKRPHPPGHSNGPPSVPHQPRPSGDHGNGHNNDGKSANHSDHAGNGSGGHGSDNDHRTDGKK